VSPFKTAIEIPPNQTDPRNFRILARITNAADRNTDILNPDMGVPSPAMKWPFSGEAYQTAMLISFGYLTMAVTDEGGRDLRREPIETWATPVLRPRLDLKPGESVELTVPLGTFYRLESGKTYRVTLGYGDTTPKAEASASVTVP
jgi:hypothetical protein